MSENCKSGFRPLEKMTILIGALGVPQLLFSVIFAMIFLIPSMANFSLLGSPVQDETDVEWPHRGRAYRRSSLRGCCKYFY